MTPEERAELVRRRREAAGALPPRPPGTSRRDPRQQQSSPPIGETARDVAQTLYKFANPARSLVDMMLQPTEPEGYSRAESLGAGAADTLTLGNAGTFQAGAEATHGGGYGLPLASLLMGGVNAASNIINPGNPLINADAQTQANDDAISANPWTAFAGQIAGALGPGILANGAVRGFLHATGGGINLLKQPDKLAQVANWMNNKVLGRIVTNGGIGALEGGIYARSKEEDTALGAGAGLAGGVLGGAALGEALPAASRLVTGSMTKWNARANLLTRMRENARTVDNPLGAPPASQQAEIERLGPLATLADVDDAARRRAVGATTSKDWVEHMGELSRLHEGRLGRFVPGEGRYPGTIYGQFENEMTSILPRDFQRVAGPIVDEARAYDIAKANAKNYFRSLQDEFDQALDSFHFATEEPIIRGALEEAMSNITPTTSTNAASRQVMQRLAFQLGQAAENGVEGGLRPREMHALRREVADLIDDEAAKEAPNDGVLSMLTQAKRVISEALDEVPNFSEVNQKFATEASYLRAYELGRDQLSPTRGMSPERAKIWMDNANPGDVAGLLEGTTRQLLDNMLKGGGEGRVARLLTRDDLIVKRLNEVYGEEIADKMVAAANRAVDLAETSSRIVSGSDTGRNLAEAGTLNREGVRRLLDVGIVTSNLAREAFPSAPGASTGAAGGALRRLLSGNVHPEEAGELARMLSQQGPTNIRAVLEDLAAVDRAVVPKTLGGLNREVTPPSGTLMDDLLRTPIGRTDVGEVPGIASGLLLPAITENTANKQNRRRTRRRARRQNAQR